jgi:hypothetical protein
MMFARALLGRIRRIFQRGPDPNLSTSLLGFRSATLGFLLAGTAMATGQTLFRVTERANPGNPINLVGDGIDAGATVFACELAADGTPRMPAKLEVVGRTSGVVQALIPESFHRGVWQAWVEKGGNPSNRFFINRPDIYFFDQDRVLPGDQLTVYGRDFQLMGTDTKPKVEIVSSSGASEPATVLEFSPYFCTIQVPPDLNGGSSYSITLSNGSGGAPGTPRSDAVFSVSKGNDPFGLKVGWGSDFQFASNVINVQSDPRLKVHASGNGSEDLACIQSAVDLATKSGGGVVYLPAGTYRIAGDVGLKMRSNVVLKGDGIGKTVVDYGYNFTPTGPPPKAYIWSIDASGCQRTGLFGITFVNLNGNPTISPTILLSSEGKLESDEVFVRNCDLNLGNGYGLRAMLATHLLVCDSTLETTNMLGSSAEFRGSKFVIVRRCDFRYGFGRVQLSYDLNAVFENNTVERDNNFSVPGSREAGGVETSSARFLVVRHNTIEGVGPFPGKTGDGELIDAQRSNITDMEDEGTVTSATPTSLDCATANWPTDRPFSNPNLALLDRAMVAIVAGKGMGEWRFIVSSTASELTVDKPWDVVPDTTSTYTIGWWAADRQLILDNTLSNSSVGINFWSGGWKCVIDGNTITDTSGINLRGEDVLGDNKNRTLSTYSRRRHSVAWDNWISNNNVTNVHGYRPAKIAVYGVNLEGASVGNLLLNTEVRGNQIISMVKGTTHPEQSGSTEGLWNHVVTVGKRAAPDPISDIGTLMINNDIEGIDEPVHEQNVAGSVVVVHKSG